MTNVKKNRKKKNCMTAVRFQHEKMLLSFYKQFDYSPSNNKMKGTCFPSSLVEVNNTTSNHHNNSCVQQFEKVNACTSAQILYKKNLYLFPQKALT